MKRTVLFLTIILSFLMRANAQSLGEIPYKTFDFRGISVEQSGVVWLSFSKSTEMNAIKIDEDFSFPLDFQVDSIYYFGKNKDNDKVLELSLTTEYSDLTFFLDTKSKDFKGFKKKLKNFGITEGFSRPDAKSFIKTKDKKYLDYEDSIFAYEKNSGIYKDYPPKKIEDWEKKRDSINALNNINDSLLRIIIKDYNKILHERVERASMLHGKLAENGEAILKKHPIHLLRYSIEDVNSAGGVDIGISFCCTNGKRIKYAYFTCKIKNRVGDYLKNEIGGNSVINLKAMGNDTFDYITERDFQGYYWERCFYNSWSDELVLTNMKITFFDGSSLNYDINGIHRIEQSDEELNRVLGLISVVKDERKKYEKEMDFYKARRIVIGLDENSDFRDFYDAHPKKPSDFKKTEDLNDSYSRAQERISNLKKLYRFKERKSISKGTIVQVGKHHLVF